MNAHLNEHQGQQIMVKKEPNTIKQEVTQTVSAIQPQSTSSANELESKINTLSAEKKKN